MIEGAPYFHVGYAVPRLQEAMAELTRTTGVQWQETREVAFETTGCRLVYSFDGPPFIELIQGMPGSPWHTDHGYLHHVGRFSTNLDAEIERFAAAGATIEVDGRDLGGRWGYFRFPSTGGLIEVIEASAETQRDRLSPSG